jgi:type VI secretion system protein ImpE
MTAHEQYQQGKLREAVAAALEDVKKNPADASKRGFLAELLCLSGELDRADRQLDALGQQDPETMMEVSLFRHLIHAEKIRQEVFTSGRLPEFVNKEITPVLRLHLEAAVQVRAGMPAEAAKLLAQAQQERPAVSGTCNGKPFEGFCDLDDMTSSFFEVLTSTGMYYWIPYDRVESLEFGSMTRPRDLMWRCAQMVVREGPDAEVFVPAIYAGSSGDQHDEIRLGRATDWRSEGGAPVRGFGQRVFLMGEEDCPILEIKKLTFGS